MMIKGLHSEILYVDAANLDVSPQATRSHLLHLRTKASLARRG